MKELRLVLFVALLVNFVNDNHAQDCGVFVPGSGFGGVSAGTYRRPPPPDFAHIREADVMWMKRYWRVLDLREKMNHPYFYPIDPIAGRQNLVTCLLNGICSQEATGYDPISDEFIIELTRAEVASATSKVDTIYIENEEGVMEPKGIPTSFDPASVKRIRIKEDWIFHNGRSTLEKQIIGICPVMEKYDENGEYKGEMPLFWMYYPSIRRLLQSQLVQNSKNPAEPFTYDRLLSIRFFSSYVYKESNVYDRLISDYKTDLDLLLESKKIETELFNMEQDLWEY